MLIRAIVGAGAFLSVAATAVPSGGRDPTAKWVVDFADAKCVASRNYGSADDPLYLVLKAPPLGDVLQIAIIRKGRLETAIQMEAEVVIDDKEPIQTNLLEFGSPELGQRAIYLNLPWRDVSSIQDASMMRVRTHDRNRTVARNRIPVSRRQISEPFALSSMKQLIDVLSDCTADLRKVWNIPEDGGRSPMLKQKAEGNLEGIFNSTDYPWMAMARNKQGSVRVAILVDETGRVADCTVIEASGVASLDAQSCAIIRNRARFTPAIGVDGKPAKSAYLPRITWRLR